MIYSMTGYAAVSEELAAGTLSLELRSVNHRYLDVQFRLPDELRAFEPALREPITARLSRGKVECRVLLTRSAASAQALLVNTALLARLAELEAEVRALLPHSGRLSAGDVLRFPGMLESEAMAGEALRDSCLALLERALAEFADTRAREGAKLSQMLLERVARIGQLVETVRPRVPQLVAAFQERLSARLKEAGMSADDDRMRQEVVMFAARVDVEEELSRLAAHLSEIRRVLEGGGAVGKRLDFLMQELNREANTLGSKSVEAEVSRASVEMKVLIEQMREQIQNIE